MNEANPAPLFLRHLKIWSTGDFASFDEIISPEYVGHADSGTRDRNGLRAAIERFRLRYPDIRFQIVDQFVTGDKVATRLRAEGTDSRAGTRAELSGTNMSRVADGRIVEEWMTWEIEPQKETP
ncbi:MAG TPA: nuclear transport factor 2 family protein [Candidatus Eisenbacteria bacterium]